MHKYLQPKAVNNNAKPNKLMYGLFNSEAKFLTIRITKCIGIYIDESEKDILF